jgi:hypothetical protein
MPVPLSLTAQFNMRTVYVITEDDDERLNNIYWLSTPMGDESDHEQEMVCSISHISFKNSAFLISDLTQVI